MELVTHTHLQMEHCLHEAGVLCCTCRKTSKLNQQGRRGITTQHSSPTLALHTGLQHLWLSLCWYLQQAKQNVHCEV